MNQFKKAQVLLLPTEKASQLCIYNKELYYVIDGEFNLNRDKYNIYITSDDEIKLGDWSYNIANKTIFQADSQFVKLINQKEVTTNKKIIATTDTSLTPKLHIGEVVDNSYHKEFHNILPKLSQQFIEKYIESYNKDEVITGVLVEYLDELKDFQNTFKCDTNPHNLENNKLKINPKDNTITIKKLKDSWTRKEITKLMVLSFQKGIESQYNNWDDDDFNLDKWINNNL